MCALLTLCLTSCAKHCDNPSELSYRNKHSRVVLRRCFIPYIFQGYWLVLALQVLVEWLAPCLTLAGDKGIEGLLEQADLWASLVKSSTEPTELPKAVQTASECLLRLLCAIARCCLPASLQIVQSLETYLT